jgi:hypothetical protein
MVSHQGTSFAEDMGYRSKSGGWLPGICVFKRDGRWILRVSDATFEPGDDFCPSGTSSIFCRAARAIGRRSSAISEA